MRTPSVSSATPTAAPTATGRTPTTPPQPADGATGLNDGSGNYNDVQCYKEDARRADYYCDQTGYSLSGSICEKKDSYPATYKCGAGYTPVGSGRCASYDYVDSTPRCAYGYTLSDDGLKCAKKEYKDASYGCPDGYIFDFGVADDSHGKTPCTKYSVVKPYGSSCPPGSEQGYDKVSQAFVCRKIEYAVPVRSCYGDYQLQGDKCYKIDYKQPAYECPGGYEPSGNGRKCVKTSYTDAYPVCRKGYTYAAGKCESYDSYTALKKCDDGYKLSGDYCRKVYYDEPQVQLPIRIHPGGLHLHQEGHFRALLRVSVRVHPGGTWTQVLQGEDERALVQV